jgi:hypothetical protein
MANSQEWKQHEHIPFGRILPKKRLPLILQFSFNSGQIADFCITDPPIVPQTGDAIDFNWLYYRHEIRDADVNIEELREVCPYLYAERGSIVYNAEYVLITINLFEEKHWDSMRNRSK